MDKGKLKGHAALWVANIVWGLNAPIGKSVLWSEANPGGVNPFALSVYRMVGAALLFWTVSLLLPRERVARRDIALLLLACLLYTSMVALKACGVRGRSSWGRMLVSDAFSAGLMAIGVNSLKYSCRVMRPCLLYTSRRVWANESSSPTSWR